MVDPESLIPKLPSISELQPFPSWEALVIILLFCNFKEI